MGIIDQMRALAEELQNWRPPFPVNFNPLPTGLTFLHLGLGGRGFVMAYYPKPGGIGVNEALEDEGFEMGYKHWFTEFEPAMAKLLSMLDDAVKGTLI